MLRSFSSYVDRRFFKNQGIWGGGGGGICLKKYTGNFLMKRMETTCKFLCKKKNTLKNVCNTWKTPGKDMEFYLILNVATLDNCTIPNWVK